MLEIVVGKHPVCNKHKANKRNCKIVSGIGFIITKNAKPKYPSICAQNCHVIMKLYNFLKTKINTILCEQNHFMFNDTLYVQVDWVSMGSPL